MAKSAAAKNIEAGVKEEIPAVEWISVKDRSDSKYFWMKYETAELAGTAMVRSQADAVSVIRQHIADNAK